MFIGKETNKNILNIDILTEKLTKKKTEKQISLVSNNKTETYNKKWYITDVLSVT